MNRRELLQCAAIAIGGMNVSRLGFALSPEQQAYVASAPNYNTREVNFLSDAQRRIVTSICEIIIPRTDTPGAIDAGAPRFVELMAADWLNEQEQATFMAGLEDLEQRIPSDYGKSFDQLNANQQTDVLEALEDAAADSSWYEFTNVNRQFNSDAPFICQIKELTIWGFFTSEVGSREVLRYNPMPMQFDGDVPLAPEDSSWAARVYL